jgi:hypothetical protein
VISVTCKEFLAVEFHLSLSEATSFESFVEISSIVVLPSSFSAFAIATVTQSHAAAPFDLCFLKKLVRIDHAAADFRFDDGDRFFALETDRFASGVQPVDDFGIQLVSFRLELFDLRIVSDR